jgi:ABC-type dipeptide/oligopeptide/nickel transport system permease subunit
MPVFVIGELLILVVFLPLNEHGFHWIQTGYCGPSQGLGAWFGHMILPWITLAPVQAAVYSRLSRGQLLDTLGEDYIRTARAKCLSERRVIFRQASGEAAGGDSQAVSLSAPTGSGKTIMATAAIERLIVGDEDAGPLPEATFLWITDQPELNEQTRRRD